MPKIQFRGFGGGLGHKVHDPRLSGYAICTNAITRFGVLMNGLKEVAEPTGIAAGFRTIKEIKHNDVQIRITHNGTNSKIYRIESGAWVLKETVSSAKATDVISYHDGTNSILAWCFGGDVAFRYSVDDGDNWTASTFSGTSDNPKFFLNDQNNLTGPRVLWVVDPNELYFASSLVNGTTISTSSTVGDASSQEYFTSLMQNDLGVVYLGKRHYLYAYANGPSVVVAGPHNDPPADAGGQSDRANFENPQVMSNGWIIYQVEGYDLIAVRGRDIITNIAPRWTPRLNNWVLPRLELPINAILAIGDYLIVALGSGNTASNRGVVASPGAGNLLQNTFVTLSELYVGQLINNEMVWHGSELTCTDLLRYLSYDENDGYMYLHSGASENANAQAKRCFFFTSAPEITLSSSNIQLNVTASAVLETAVIGASDPFDREVWDYIQCLTTGLASSAPSIAAAIRLVPEHDTSSGFITVETYHDGMRALTGTSLRGHMQSGTVGRIRFTLAADSGSSPDVFGTLRSVELTTSQFAKRKHGVGAL